MKVITTPENVYHKAGTVLDLDDHTANALIKKGYAGTGEEKKEVKEKSNKEKKVK